MTNPKSKYYQIPNKPKIPNPKPFRILKLGFLPAGRQVFGSIGII
jgi:hypothetical protein